MDIKIFVVEGETETRYVLCHHDADDADVPPAKIITICSHFYFRTILRHCFHTLGTSYYELFNNNHTSCTLIHVSSQENIMVHPHNTLFNALFKISMFPSEKSSLEYSLTMNSPNLS